MAKVALVLSLSLKNWPQPRLSAQPLKKSSLLSLETSDTMTEVQVEELCTRTVNKMAIMRPTIGFASNALLWKIVPGTEENNFSFVIA